MRVIPGGGAAGYRESQPVRYGCRGCGKAVGARGPVTRTEDGARADPILLNYANNGFTGRRPNRPGRAPHRGRIPTGVHRLDESGRRRYAPDMSCVAPGIRPVAIAAALTALLAVSLAPAGVPAAEATEAAPRLYTNADLARFGDPSPLRSTPIAAHESGWLDVQAFLDREYARIDAERRHELTRRESERRDRMIDGGRERSPRALPLAWHRWWLAAGECGNAITAPVRPGRQPRNPLPSRPIRRPGAPQRSR